MKGEGTPFPGGKKLFPPLAPSFPQNRPSGLACITGSLFLWLRKLRDVPALKKFCPINSRQEEGRLEKA